VDIRQGQKDLPVQRSSGNTQRLILERDVLRSGHDFVSGRTKTRQDRGADLRFDVEDEDKTNCNDTNFAIPLRNLYDFFMQSGACPQERQTQRSDSMD
jgi:hypothetical protein